MSGRTSRLDTLLRVRRIEEETGRGRLAAAAHAERAAHALLEQASREYAVAVDGAAPQDANTPEVAPTAARDAAAPRPNQRKAAQPAPAAARVNLPAREAAVRERVVPAAKSTRRPADEVPGEAPVPAQSAQ